jgi:dipeptidyl-peptidase-4
VRQSGEGYDLNRDGIKADALETKGLLKNVLLKWDPVLIVDLHTTNGSWHGYSLTYAPPYNPAGHQGPSGYLMDTMLPDITETLEKRYDMNTYLYGEFSGYPPESWYNYGDQPRFIVNYMGLRNRMAILSESFSHDPFEKRILSSRLFATEIIKYSNRHGREMTDIIESADDETINDVISKAGEFEKGVDFEVTARDELIDLLVYEQVPVIDPETGEESYQLTDNIITVSGVELFNKYEPVKLSAFPGGYIFPAELTGVADKLIEHGINVEVLEEPVKVKGEDFVVTAFTKNSGEFQKHHLVTLEGRFVSGTREFPAGSFHVDLSQSLANLAFYMLEPESDDGLATWNFFDDYLIEQGVETGEVLFPVFKYFKEE